MIDFNEELKVIGEYKTVPLAKGVQRPPMPKRNTPISPLENYKRFIKRDKPIWTPTGSDFITFIPRIIPDNVARGFVFDSDPIDNVKEAGGKDMFGVEWEFVPVVGGSMVRPGNPLKIPDITKWEEYLEFPDLSAYDWKGSVERNRHVLFNDNVTMIWVQTGLFERLISFMEFENAALALIDEDQQDYVHSLMDRLCVFYDEYFDYLKKYYDVNVIYFHDDWGSQRAPFFSRATCEEMIMPYLKRVCESAHKRDIFIDFHSCGMVEPLLPCMIEAGCDTWSGQPMNDKLKMLRLYGDRITINLSPYAAFSVAPEELTKATEEFLSTYGDYISSIIISPMMATSDMYEMVYRFSRKKLAE